jgi:hypothetical protein
VRTRWSDVPISLVMTPVGYESARADEVVEVGVVVGGAVDEVVELVLGALVVVVVVSAERSSSPTRLHAGATSDTTTQTTAALDHLMARVCRRWPQSTFSTSSLSPEQLRVRM